MITPTLTTRFWRHVDKRGPDDCWLWTGDHNGQGRARMHMGWWYDGTKRKHLRVYASHIAWELAHGPIAEGLKVLHRCDNGLCCNAKHLFLGTQADNIRDMHEKGRADSFGHNAEVRSGVRINRRRGERIAKQEA